MTLQWKRDVVAALTPLELTHVQFVLLASTWWAGTKLGTPPSQRTLAEYAGTDPMMTSQVLRTLEKRGLVTRTPDPLDGRSRLVEVTAAGAQLAPRAIEVVEAVDRAFFSPTPTAEILATLTALDRPRD